MKVKELIAQLQEFDPELSVAVNDQANEMRMGVDGVEGVATLEKFATSKFGPDTEPVVVLSLSTEPTWMSTE